MQFTPAELWAHMGWFARAVVLAMVFMSVTSVMVTVERVLVFHTSRKDSVRFLEKLMPLLNTADLAGAAALKSDAHAGHLGRTLAAGLMAYRNADEEDPDYAKESVARALERHSQREVANLRRGQGYLATVSSTAPFVGLLGTVMGIVNSFETMASTGSGGLASVSAGIAEALVTTAIGLLVAIPALASFNYLNSWVDRAALDLSESANELLDLVERTCRRRARER